MKKWTPMVQGMLMLVLAASSFLSGCKKEDNRPTSTPNVTGPNILFYGITAGGQLQQFNAMAPGTVVSSVAVSGLQSGESITAIDFRPATGELYGLSSGSRLYIINTKTGSTRMVGAAPITPAINGTIIGMDFNPTVDRLRVATNLGENLRINPETGTLVAADGAINGVAGAMVNAVAYTNNVAGTATTTLFDIDLTTQTLYKQIPPNNGTLVPVGSLGIMPTAEGGFDISPDNSAVLANLMVDGKYSLFTIDTASGKAARIGDLPATDAVKSIAIPTLPVAYAVDGMNNFYIFNPSASTASVTKTIAGLMAGETLKGIDFRPLNGQLYGLGSTGRIYTLNAANGAATVVGAGPYASLNGAYFGFDFNPVVDRIRVVSRNGQNLRLHPVTGLLVATDAMLNPGMPSVSSAAYTNNFAGTTTTTLYDIDCRTDSLYMQVPPNDGTLVPVGAIGVDAQSENGFDIGSTSGIAYALFTVSSSHGLYTINLNTGAATKLMDFPVKVNGFTIGLGF